MARSQYYTTNVNGNRSYGSVPEQVREDAESRIGLFDNYILYRTGESQYTLYVNKVIGQDYAVTYSYSSGYYSYSVDNWTVEEPSLTAPMYSYSNQGYGYTLTSNYVDTFSAYCLGGIVVLLFLAVLFKGVLFRCLKR